jgi:hypothetical protein
MLSRWAITRRLLFEPWRWLALTVVWTLFSHGTTIRDNLLPVEWRAHLQVLDYFPTWPWWVWIMGVLLITVIMLFVGASRWIAKLDRALHDRELPGRNADEIAPWREKGRTLTNEWRHLLQHGVESLYPRAEEEADEWRINMRQRLERKYGAWVATHFNETREVDSAGLPFLSHLAEHDARAERLAQIMYDVGTTRIHPRNQEPF